MNAKFLALSGGVGGAKLCLGLDRILPAGALSVLVNTGDDFTHLGLRISPDIDTVLYTLGGLSNRELGWGRADETWHFMEAMEMLGGASWFRLGDRDLALHVERTRRLAEGETLSEVTLAIAERLALHTAVLPMSDDSVATMVLTDEGELPFQDYFVRRRCMPAVKHLRFAHAADATVSKAAMNALRDPALQAIVIAPSNPYLSIDPILALPGMTDAIRATGVPVIAVTPIIGDSAVKGPTAKIMRELGIAPSPLSIAAHYRDLIDGFVLDRTDQALAADFDVPVHVCNTLMHSLEDRTQLAGEVLDFADRLRLQRRRA